MIHCGKHLHNLLLPLLRLAIPLGGTIINIIASNQSKQVVCIWRCPPYQFVKDFKDKVAVVTGAASGIGRALAERCAQEGMKVVLAGINAENLKKTEQVLRAEGAIVLSVPTDVAKLADIEALAQKTLSAFGAVHLLFNNAGVGAGSTIWESSLADWQWVMGVNLWGVIFGLRIFVPIMLAQDTECHIVNTASIVGLMPPFHPFAPYQVSKHAVVAL